MNDIEADLPIANARIKQLEQQLADYHHMSELVNGKMAENARLRRINEKLTARAEAAEAERDAAVEDLKLALIDETLDPCHCCEYGRTNHCTHPDGPTCGETGGKNWQWRGPQAGKGAK